MSTSLVFIGSMIAPVPSRMLLMMALRRNSGGVPRQHQQWADKMSSGAGMYSSCDDWTGYDPYTFEVS